MSETVFKPGEVVQLKSGGPLMTIVKIGSDFGSHEGVESAEVNWFDKEHEPQTDVFPLHTLKKYEERRNVAVGVSSTRGRGGF